MQTLIILSYSWSPFILLNYLCGENELLLGPVNPLEFFREKKLPQFQENTFVMKHFTKLSLSDIINHGESDVERQISIQDIHLSAFGIFVRTEKEATINKRWHVHTYKHTLDDSHRTGTNEMVLQLKVFKQYILTVFFINILNFVFSFLCSLQCSLQHF